MPYTIESRVRYSEIGRDRGLTIPGVIDYFQDCGTFQAEDLGLGIDYMAKEQLANFLTSWHIVFHKFPYLGDKVMISTWAAEYKHLMAKRDFQMLDADSKPIIEAESEWVCMDLAEGRPIPFTDIMVERYGVEPELELKKTTRHIRLPKTMESLESFPVLKHHIDTNDHVNNCQYISMALEMISRSSRIDELRVEYRQSAVLGDVIYPRRSVSEDKAYIALENEDGVTYVNIEFKGELHV